MNVFEFCLCVCVSLGVLCRPCRGGWQRSTHWAQREATAVGQVGWVIFSFLFKIILNTQNWLAFIFSSNYILCATTPLYFSESSFKTFPILVSINRDRGAHPRRLETMQPRGGLELTPVKWAHGREINWVQQRICDWNGLVMGVILGSLWQAGNRKLKPYIWYTVKMNWGGH